MDFTREPIIETVITPKEGCKIVVRSSKYVGQEEYFVDALEVVSFGNALFYRSLEKPKAFLVPASDYEILEVREARMVLKNVGLDRSIKIGGGREPKAVKEPVVEKVESVEEVVASAEEPTATDNRTEKKRDRRRQQRRRRGREEPAKEEALASEVSLPIDGTITSVQGMVATGEIGSSEISTTQVPPSTFISSLLPPPPTLISETIGRYKENVLFKNAFYTKEEVDASKTEEPKKNGVEKEEEVKKIVESTLEATEPLSQEEKETPSPFASFWDDITAPSKPSTPFLEKIEDEENSSQNPPSSEENKE